MEILLGQSQQGGGVAAFLPFILIMFIIYFLMIRPQTKRQKEKEKMRNNIKKGDKFNAVNIRRIRPGQGIAPEFYSKLLGQRSPHSYTEGEPIKMKTIDKLNKK